MFPRERARQNFDRQRNQELAPFLYNPIVNLTHYEDHIHAQSSSPEEAELGIRHTNSSPWS